MLVLGGETDPDGRARRALLGVLARRALLLARGELLRLLAARGGETDPAGLLGGLGRRALRAGGSSRQR